MPDLARFGDRREIQKQHLDKLSDILKSDPTSPITDYAVKPGGITMDHALHTWTLSLTQLRRLRFPIGDKCTDEGNDCARTAVAALALYALALQQEHGYWLRSRCELVPANGFELEIVGGTHSGPYGLGTAEKVRKELFKPAYDAACNAKLPWENRVIRLTPSPQLAELVRRSDALQPEASDAPQPEADEQNAEEDADAGDQS